MHSMPTGPIGADTNIPIRIPFKSVSIIYLFPSLLFGRAKIQLFRLSKHQKRGSSFVWSLFCEKGVAAYGDGGEKRHSCKYPWQYNHVTQVSDLEFKPFEHTLCKQPVKCV